ncbi:THUMP domain-containing protein [Heracleum sosnowskyi]|uniref:THUMP domain-containing protein n=1 Tax=Heracleum sosnowskyi TaxID=360622 RepID=A0AAD8MGU5_9APIA|nr:THUMP domain-containing protein [Heracleum sosnowskyi]
MAGENKSKPNNGGGGKKRKNRYLPQNKGVKKGGYPLKPGVQGFFITCDGGRERQASHEAINVIDTFYEELVSGRKSGVKYAELQDKPVNKKVTFTYSDTDEDDDEVNDQNDEGGKDDLDTNKESAHEGLCSENEDNDDIKEDSKSQVVEAEVLPTKKQCLEQDALKSVEEEQDKSDSNNGNALEGVENHENSNKDDIKEDAKGQEVEAEVHPLKKQCLEQDASKPEKRIGYKVAGKSVDQLIEAELEELKDKSKKRFIFLDTGCNGVVFVQMLRKDGDPSPKEIAQHMIESVALTKKHMSRFLLRVLPIEVSCYASDEEITRAIKPLIEQHFPVETQTPHKYAVLYEARANTGVDRMKIIDAVAKSVPGPHTVDLKNPDKNIVVQIARTVCLIGVVEKYKELAKYNLRQLTSSNE